MPKAAFCGLPHSESEVYYVKSSAIGRELSGTSFLYRQADACHSPILLLMTARSIIRRQNHRRQRHETNSYDTMFVPCQLCRILGGEISTISTHARAVISPGCGSRIHIHKLARSDCGIRTALRRHFNRSLVPLTQFCKSFLKCDGVIGGDGWKYRFQIHFFDGPFLRGPRNLMLFLSPVFK